MLLRGTVPGIWASSPNRMPPNQNTFTLYFALYRCFPFLWVLLYIRCVFLLLCLRCNLLCIACFVLCLTFYLKSCLVFLLGAVALHFCCVFLLYTFPLFSALYFCSTQPPTSRREVGRQPPYPPKTFYFAIDKWINEQK